MSGAERLVTSAEMKHMDDRTIVIHGVPSLVLMERAALASAEALREEGFDLARVLCVCGPGNNGGDGFAVCRLLRLAGHDATVVFVGDPAKRSAETRQQWRIAESYGVPVVAWAEFGASGASAAAPATTVVDAVFGIGGGRAPAGDFAEAIRWMGAARGAGARVLSLDIPSGVSADTGEAPGEAVQADVTVTFAYRKVGHTRPPGSGLSGKVLVKDIGIYAENEECL
ncbi:MAG: NAD(P)H-hydrate epimerase [Clostridiales Family XIII bacterium]|jgi:NAD(P)H-hydrate epimerase|nr:NAD(P)H-hydrate epimerase [Clostridiales Family XIII bacterium]